MSHKLGKITTYVVVVTRQEGLRSRAAGAGCQLAWFDLGERRKGVAWNIPSPVGSPRDGIDDAEARLFFFGSCSSDNNPIEERRLLCSPEFVM